MTILCGMAHNYVQLLLARIGVGVGEAGCTPAAHSLITDTVEPSKRSSAIAFYGLGIPIGTLLGLVIGRSEEQTSELQSLMRISYAVFCLKKKTKKKTHQN